ncbi:FAD1 flavin adenine dinucleotide synthetase, partial [Ascosphaera atra]
MRHLYKPNQSNADFDFDHPSDALDAKMRMLHLPIDESKPIEDQVLFPDDELWVPLSVENENVYIFPGIPALQRRMLEGIKPRIAERARLAAKGEG